MTPGRTFLLLLDKWQKQYARELGRPVESVDPILCREVLGAARQGGPRRIDWGRHVAQRTYFHLVQRRAHIAGLGHIAPHDLRRTAAAILHRDKTDDGGHRFDLLDIQQVLDHADPATTQRSYLEQLDLDTKDRAASVLD